MTDRELARTIERCEMPSAGFRHLDHLRVAWVYLEECSTVADAVDRMTVTLKCLARAVGAPEKFSQPITEFWIYELAAARALMPNASVDEVFARCPSLLDKTLVLSYVSNNSAADDSAVASGNPPGRVVPRDQIGRASCRERE